MAIYHCSVKTISRGTGQSIVASAAYRHACMLTDARTGEIHDYTKKRGVEFSEIFLPSGVNNPLLKNNREQLWNAVEAAETRKNSRLGRDVEIAIPNELSREQREALVSNFSRQLADRYSLAVDAAIHQPHRHGDARNWHAHILLSSRRLTQDGFGEKARELDDMKQGPMEVERIREEWAQLANHALERAERHERIDHRSLRAQGVKRMPAVHMGPSASSMEKRGITTRLGDKNREAQAFNMQLASLDAERERIEVEHSAINESKNNPENVKELQSKGVTELRHEKTGPLECSFTAQKTAAEAERARISEQELFKKLGIEGLSRQEFTKKYQKVLSDLSEHVQAQNEWRDLLQKDKQSLAQQGKLTRWIEGTFYTNGAAKRVVKTQEGLRTLESRIGELKEQKAAFGQVEDIFKARDTTEREKQAQKERYQEQEKAAAFDRRIEKANNHNDYLTLFHEIAKQDKPNLIDRYYDEWAASYMETIKSAGADHQTAFRQCVELAKRDVTTDKALLQGMESKLYQAMRGLPGTVGQHTDQVREMMGAIRLHGDRQQGFERVAGPLIDKREHQRSRAPSMGR